MSSFRYGFGFVPNYRRSLGAGITTATVGALATYTAYSPSNFTLVTGNNVNVWNDETTNTNNLTQGTSANQPVLVEDNTVTQFTASNQPTYDQVGGVDVMVFDGAKNLTGLGVAGDASRVFEFTTALLSNIAYLSSSQASPTSGNVYLNNSTGVFFVVTESDTIYTFSDTLPTDMLQHRYKIVITNSNECSVFVDDIQIDVTKTLDDDVDVAQIGRASGSGFAHYLSSFKQWNSADSSGAPDLTLTADPTKMRTSANANPTLGQDVAKWYADEWSGYRDNHVLFDPVKYMEGLPTQAGDFTYIFKYKDNDQATAGAIVSSNIDASGIFNVDGDTTDLRAGDATNYLFDNTGATTYRMVAYSKSGNDVYNVTDYVTTPTQDATGKAFNLTSLGKATSGKAMEIKEFYVFDRKLTGSELDYFFYLRNVNTGDILPLLPS